MLQRNGRPLEDDANPVKRLRYNEKGKQVMTQKDMVTFLELSQSTVSKIEADILDIDVRSLFKIMGRYGERRVVEIVQHYRRD